VFWEYAPDFTPDLRTVFADLLIGGFAIAAVGLIPAFKLSRADLAVLMKDGGAQASAAFGRARLRQLLLAAQVAASCVLLVLAGLMLRSVQRVMMDVGFDVDRVAIVSAPLRSHGIGGNQIASYWTAMRDAVASSEETEAVALVARSPLDQSLPTIALPNGTHVKAAEVDGEFFKVMGIPLVAGRAFDNSDESGNTIILSKSLAMATYGTLDIIGQLFPQTGERRTIVGVAGNARLSKGDGPETAITYLPLNPALPDRELIARARNDARNLLPLMRGAAASANDKAIADAHLLSYEFANRTVEPRAMTALLSALALLAVSLTCAGLIGIISYSAALRRKELGIRMALGANRASVVRALVHDVQWPLLGGILFGAFAGVTFGGMFAGVPLFVKPFDPPILVAASLFLAAVAGIAAALPAWRALHVDITHSLRCE